MKTVYILEAKWHDTINRCRKSTLVGVYDNLEKLEKVKKSILAQPHDYTSISFAIKSEIQLFA